MEDIKKEREKEEKENKNSKEILIPVKFNKETKNIPLSEASELLQKGMKFDLISEDFKKLKELALKENMSLGEYVSHLEQKKSDSDYQKLLEECAGNEKIAKRIQGLEKGEKAKEIDLSEITEYFPKIKGEEDLPESVRETISLKGENPLNVYLRYLLKEKQKLKRLEKQQSDAENSGIGSQSKNEASGFDAAANQFLKGIWSR